MKGIRNFALISIDDFDNEIERFDLKYIEKPKNLGFELEFTKLESKLTTYFTGSREKKMQVSFNVYFEGPNAYRKANNLKKFVQRTANKRILLEYDDTESKKYYEGKVLKLSVEELDAWGGMTCPMTFESGTPKFERRDNTVQILPATTGKMYDFNYAYSYGEALVRNNLIANDYFDEIPLRVFLYGKMVNPQVALKVADSAEIYSIVRFEDLTIEEGEHLIIDAINAKILLWRQGKYISAYDYISKQAGFDTFLFAKQNETSEIVINLSPSEKGFLKANYRQYLL